MVAVLQALLTELARIRKFGFSPREVEIAQAKLMADIESAYLERDQSYSTDVREEYVRHFLHGALTTSLPLIPASCLRWSLSMVLSS